MMFTVKIRVAFCHQLFINPEVSDSHVFDRVEMKFNDDLIGFEVWLHYFNRVLKINQNNVVDI